MNNELIDRCAEAIAEAVAKAKGQKNQHGPLNHPFGSPISYREMAVAVLQTAEIGGLVDQLDQALSALYRGTRLSPNASLLRNIEAHLEKFEESEGP